MYTPKTQRTPDETLERVSGSLMNVYNTYQGQKEKAHSEAVLNNPDSTPIQQAMALAKLGNKELANEVYKGSIKQAELAAKQSGKESAKDVYRGGGFGGGQDQPRDRSWRDALQGRTPTIMPEERPDIASDQTGAAVEGSPTQPGFSPSAPNRAAANALRGPQQMQMPGGLGLTGNQYQQPPQINMDQGQQQQQPPLDPSQVAQQMRQQAGMMNIDRPGSGNALLAQAESIEKNARAEKQEQLKQQNIDRKERLSIHDSLEKPYNKIQSEAEHADSHLRSMAVARKAIASGNVGTKGWKGIARTMFKGSKWEDYWKNEDQALLEAAALEDYVGMKDMFGTRLSDADLEVVSKKVVSPYKSDESNLAIIDYREFQDKMKIAKAKVADDIIEENGGFRPINLQKQIKQRMGELYGDEADRVLENALYEGKPVPKPSPQDPLMESMYGKVPENQVRLKKGSEVITIPYAYLEDALTDEYVPFEKGAE